MTSLASRILEKESEYATVSNFIHEDREKKPIFKEREFVQFSSLNFPEPRAAWVKPVINKCYPPSALTVTKVNQSYSLAKEESQIHDAEKLTSQEWLEHHNVNKLGLSLDHLIKKGVVGKPKLDQATNKLKQHLEFKASDISIFESRLHHTIRSYTGRLKWLLSDSRGIFGLVPGKRVGLAIDISDGNVGYGRLENLQDSLMHLIDDQLTKKSKIFLASFGTDVRACWRNPRKTNCRIIDEAKEFVMKFEPSGSCNLLKALKVLFSVPDLDTYVLILGGVPDQKADIVSSFVEQTQMIDPKRFHCISWNCSSQTSTATLRSLAEETGGRFQAYSATDEDVLYESSDVQILLGEVECAKKVLDQVEAMKKGLLNDALVTIIEELSKEVEMIPQSYYLPKPPGHDTTLKIKSLTHRYQSSKQWIRIHGLTAQKLDLYQMLKPNSYDYKSEFVSTIKKQVKSQVHHQAMTQFKWNDGTIKNVHVDVALLLEYQKQLMSVLEVYEKRCQWLSSASRSIWGTVTHDRVVLIIDLSASNSNYLIHLQHSLRLILEEQIFCESDRGRLFNVIAMTAYPQAFAKGLLPATTKNLQRAWQWVLGLGCSGTRNLIGSLKLAIENENEIEHNCKPQAIHILTSGIPDQHSQPIERFLEQICCGDACQINISYFTIDDMSAPGTRYETPKRSGETLKDLAHCCGGNFHWFEENGILECDEITIIKNEIEKCKFFYDESRKLIDFPDRTLKIEDSKSKDDDQSATQTDVAKSWIAPRDTALSEARKKIAQKQQTTPSRSSSASAKKRLSPFEAFKHLESPITTNKSSYFPLTLNFPSKEHHVSSERWFKKFGLKGIKLDLNRILYRGRECNHVEKSMKFAGGQEKLIAAKYCRILPSVVLNDGVVRHLVIRLDELNKYKNMTEQALERYIKRIQWLLSESRLIFGVICESRIVIAIDTSGSMQGCLEQIKETLKSLVWDQIFVNKCFFNLISFNDEISSFRSANTLTFGGDEANCHAAIEWIDGLTAHGKTDTLACLKAALAMDVKAVYMVTDGKPDQSMSLILSEVKGLNEKAEISVNTVSLNCDDDQVNVFLKNLAHFNHGRYHRCHSNIDAQMFLHNLLENIRQVSIEKVKFEQCGKTAMDKATIQIDLPDFEGDDLKMGVRQIQKCIKYLALTEFLIDVALTRCVPDTNSGRMTEEQRSKLAVTLSKLSEGANSIAF